MKDNEICQDPLLMALFAMASALDGGGDEGNKVPASDVQDMMDGACGIPSEVTEARRAGQVVQYDPVVKAWTMPDETVIKEGGSIDGTKD